MGIGLSDGTNYADMGEWMANSMSSTSSGMPLEGSTEPAGALNSSGGTETPDKAQLLEKAYLKALSGTENPKAVWDVVKQFASEKYEALKGALTAPGDVWAGHLDPMSPEGLERARNLAGLAVFGPAPLAAKMADGTLGSFAGVKSKAIKDKLADLGHAQVLEANAIHPDDIFTTTGFFRGADSRWRYEIDDSKAKFFPENLTKRGGQAYLSDVYAHPELYKAYPDLKYVHVIVDPNRVGAEAQAAGAQPYIVLGGKATAKSGRVASQDQGILAHEIQHIIQDYEGFAKGAAFKGEPSERIAEYYTRSAGEVEARNVDTRLNLSDSQRRIAPPTTTEDLPRRHQLVTKNVGLATESGLEDYLTGEFARAPSGR